MMKSRTMNIASAQSNVLLNCESEKLYPHLANKTR